MTLCQGFARSLSDLGYLARERRFEAAFSIVRGQQMSLFNETIGKLVQIYLFRSRSVLTTQFKYLLGIYRL